MSGRYVAVFLLILGACGQWDDDLEVVLETYDAPESAAAPMASVESGHDVVRVRGIIALPDACQAVLADLTRQESQVSLWIEYDQVQDMCSPAERNIVYTADIQGLRPGRYTLRVIHGRAGMWRGTEPVLVHPIVVSDS